MQASLALLLLLLCAMQTFAATHVALVTTGSTEAAAQTIALATAQFSADPNDIELLDRQAVNAIIREQKLSLSGLVDQEKMIQVGKLVKADLFAVVDTDPSGGQALGLVIFDTATGLRLWDGAISGNPEPAATSIHSAIRAAAAKDRKLNRGMRLVGFLPVRNANLPLERDAFCDTVRLLLERRLTASPGVAVLERGRLQQVNRERRLPTAKGREDLWPSVVLIQLEISRAPDGRGLHASATLADSSGRQLDKREASVNTDSAPDLADKLQGLLIGSLKVPAIDLPFDRRDEARRFARDSEVLIHNARFATGAAAGEAAYALQPDDEHRLILTTSLWARAWSVLTPDDVNLVEMSLGAPGPIHLSSDDLERTLALASRAVAMQQESLKEEIRGQHAGQSFMEYTGDDKRTTFLWGFAARLNAVEEVKAEFHPLISEFRSAAMAYLVDYYDAWAKSIATSPTDLINYNGGVYYAVETAANIAAGFPDFAVARDHLIHQWMKAFDRSWTVAPDLWLQAGLRQSQLMGTVLNKRSVSERGWKDYSDEKFQRSLTPVADDLNHSSCPVMRLYGSIATDLVNSQSAAPGPQAADRRLEAVLRQFEETLEHPGSPPMPTRQYAYVAAVDGIRLLSSGTKPAFEAAIDLLRRAARHRQLIPYAAMKLLMPILRRDGRPRELAVALKETVDLSGAPDCQILDGNADGVRQMLVEELHSLREQNPGLSPEKVARPWNSARRLADASDLAGISELEDFARVSGENVYFIGSGTDAEGKSFVQAFEVSLKGGPPRALAKMEVGNDAKRDSIYDGFGDHLIQGAALDDHNYYVSLYARGVVVFPRDSRPAARIDGASGLPSNWVRSLASVGGELYIVSSANDGAYLSKWNPNDKSLQVCISSLRKDTKSPLDDTPGLRIKFIIDDSPRKRLLLSVGQYSQRPGERWDDCRGGLWQFDTANGQMKHLLTAASGLDLGPARGVDHGFLYAATTLWVVEYDLAKDRARYSSFKPGSITESYIRELPIESAAMKGAGWSEPDSERPGTRRVIDRWLWIGQPFSRISADAKTVEQLDGRLAAGKEPIGPVSIMEPAAGIRLILGDRRQLYVVTLR